MAKPPKLEDLHERLAALVGPHKALDQKPLS
jgi:hypothetical protein